MPEMESLKKRLFFGIHLEPSASQRASEALHALAEEAERKNLKVSWVLPEKFHLTLRFLGELEPWCLPTLERAARRVLARAPFELELRGAGAFPNESRAQVIWLGVAKGKDALQALAIDLNESLAQEGFPLEAQSFTPHLTLGRLKGAAVGELLHGLKHRQFGVSHVETFTLFESVKRNDAGIRYVPLAPFSFQG